MLARLAFSPFRFWLVLGLCCSLISTGTLTAQEPDKAQVTAEAGDKTKEAESTWERLIYIPYKNIAAAFDRQNATVMIPYARFLELWEQAQKPKPGAAPLQAVITHAKYTGVIENNLARLQAEYKIRVLDKPWARIPLNFGEAAVGKMQPSNEQTVLVGTGEGTYDLYLPTVGEHTVQLELVTRVRTATDGRNFELLVPPVGITQLELTIPAPDQTVDVLPHLVSAPLEAEANSTKVEANVGSTNKLTVRWYPRVSQTPEMELLTSVTNQISVRIADGLVQTEAVLNYHVLRGELNQAVIAVPLGHRILDVEAPNLKGWKAANEPQRQVVTIDLLGGTAQQIPITIRTERPATNGETLELAGLAEDGQVFGIHAVGAVRESGILTVSHSDDLQLSIEQQKGLVRTEAQEVAESLRRPNGRYFKFFSPNCQLAVIVKPVEPRVTVQQQSIVQLKDDELQLQTIGEYTVERAGVFELRWKLPAGLKVQRVDCAQKQEYSVTPDGTTLVLTLQQKTIGAISVNIVATRPWQIADEPELQFPVLEPLNVVREEGQIYVLAPPALEVVTNEAALEGLQPERVAAAIAPVQQRLQDGVTRVVATWAYNRRPITLPVTISRRPTRLTARLTTFANVARELLEVRSRAMFVVEFAGVDKFRISVPESVADIVQIEPQIDSVPIKDKKRGAAENGWVTWTITTQREVIGEQIFNVEYDIKLQKTDKTATATLQPIRLLGVPADDGMTDKTPLTSLFAEIAIDKDRIWSLQATPKDLQTIDVRELTLLPQSGALAYRYSKQPVEVALSATEHEIQQVVQTVISRALIEAVMTHNDATLYRCRYLLQTSERQRLLLELPAQVQPLGVMVAGKQVNLERNPQGGSREGLEAYYVNVARSGRSEESFQVTLVYRIPGKGIPTSGIGGTLKLHLPQLGGTETPGNVAVQQLKVVVWVPEEISLVGQPSHFTPEKKLIFADGLKGVSAAYSSTEFLEHWFGNSQAGLFEFATAGHAFIYSNLGGADELEVTWWRTSWFVWLWTIVLLVIAFVLRTTTWENRLGLLLIAILGLVVWSLGNADYAVFMTSVTRFGLLGMLVIWILHAVLHYKPAPVIVREAPVDRQWAYCAVVPPPGVFEDD